MKRIEKLENCGDAKGMPLTVKGRRVSKDYLIENDIIEDWGAAPAKKDYIDTVSRQAAIDAIEEMQMPIMRSEFPEEQFVFTGMSEALNAIKRLPSAQPEIILCKDCRWGREACGNIECFVDANVPPEYHGYEWFCPNGERRTE